MTIKMTDESGNEVDVLTPEEITAETAKAVQAKESELQGKLNEVNDKLTKETAKEKNFEKLRELQEQAVKERDDLKATYEKEKAERTAKEISDYRGQLFEALSGKDEELKKKIEFHFSKFGNAGTMDKVEIDKLANDAVKLAMGEAPGALGGNVIGSGGAAPIKPGEIPAHLLSHAKAMGMTEKEFAENYSKAKSKGLIKE